MSRLIFSMLWVAMALVSQAQIYVSTKGKDSNPGSVSQPVATLHRAQAIARTFNGKQPIRVIVKPGTYYLSETIRFTSTDTKPNGVVYQAEKEGSVVISGGQKLNLQWAPYQSGIFVAMINEDVEIDQLFVNGARQRMARFPNTVEEKAVFDTWALDHHATYDSTLDPLLPDRIRKWNNPQGAYVHAMHNYLWGDMHWLVNGKNGAQLDLTGGWQNNRPSKMHPVYRMVENVFEELDAPGEWYFDRAQRKLYYYPNVGVDMKNATVEVVTLRHLIELNGTKDYPVQNIHFKGFIFRHTARTFMENKEPLQRSDWTVYRGGAIVFNGAENCTVSESEFDHVGGNTIFVNGYNKNITIKGCHIHHSGASGILFVGDSSSVRSPLYGYVKRDYSQLDTVRGPKNDAYPRDCLVEDCIITQTGRDEKQTAAVHISLAANIRINHCSIYDMPRAGINISEGNYGGHIIENSDIFNTVLETGDHGSFNSWGRDRYWTPDGKTVAGIIEKNPNWHWLDMLQPNIIRNNRWRCDFGWDIDLDDGSSHYRIYNNLLLANGLKLREGYDRIVTNNIILNNSLHPHVWFAQSGDVFKQNIVYSAYKPAVMSQVIPVNGKWGLHLDSNLFVCDEQQLRRFLKNGCDSQSITGDPMFVDPVNGDYRVLPNSPALKMGFINFDTRHFGVQRPSLKAIAKTPFLPTLIKRPMEGSSSSVNVTWMGTSIRVPSGDECSALGIGYADGGILIGEIPKASALEKAGFRSGDMIRSVNTKSIRTIEEFTGLLSKKDLNAVEWSFELIRNQQRMLLKTVHQLNTFHSNTQK